MKEISISKPPSRRSVAVCPLCNKPRETAYRPFCSKRCADIDLGRWLGGKYAFPTEEPGLIPDDETMALSSIEDTT